MDYLETQLKKLAKETFLSLKKAKGKEELENFRITYLGRKGALTSILRRVKDLPLEERKISGKRANDLKRQLEESLKVRLSQLGKKREVEKFDITLPGIKPESGHLHPITLITNEIREIFQELGFEMVAGPEIETEYYNFEALNFPPEHPARDAFDSFYLAPDTLLRSHTSPVQIRVMERRKPPLRIITVGRCYRRDAIDASHFPVFHQIEGLMVGEGISFSHLKGVLTYFLQKIFSPDIRIRFLPSYFPFTEPSAEVSISCIFCKGVGCSSCGRSGWIEILGAGMVNPIVLRKVKYDPEKFTGFAFGMGIERIAMLKYKISDIRLFWENDLRFLEQF
ncbi:MAG: phenylalanine--tRNA ligase subunit alpha [Candidatus Omnitrophica bacterium]|nr:phenylalanine--tRNA ligase subunit alpha [Candidatus Omnitrophota bacterium]